MKTNTRVGTHTQTKDNDSSRNGRRGGWTGEGRYIREVAYCLILNSASSEMWSLREARIVSLDGLRAGWTMGTHEGKWQLGRPTVDAR